MIVNRKLPSFSSRLIPLLLSLACAGNAQAQPVAAQCGAPPQPVASMSDATYDAVRRATDLLAQKKQDEAIAKLSAFTERGEPFDKAMIQYNLGVAYSAKEAYLPAAEAFAKALAFKVLPQNQSEQLQFNLGQLYVAAGQYEKGTQALQQYLAQACGTVAPEAHMFLASALAEQKRYEEAIPQVDLALSKVKAPKENWLQFKLGAQYEMKQYREAAETLLLLISLKPDKPDYWKQLSGVLLEMDDKAQALAVMALAERQGFINKPADLFNLYNIYMIIDVPVKAGLLMEQALAEEKIPADEKSLEAVANAWINAREADKAEAALKRVAAVADRGEYYFRLGGMYGDQERWKESREMLELALAKGNLKRPGDVHFRIAVADYRLGDLKSAVASLQKAQGYNETRTQAGEWLRQLTAELQAQQSVAVAGSS
ncbi:Tetratricopeptide repeat-containing protein [Solimonas aquatica]|uniref:Tetratricopeptide repeat-containing protein n=1 Tax=Solimonas aquatica TaxID=489703 RepID=A0A1H8ZT60_9GAMM|nr:tetratricopeptide repeat protein [Solimonas aquatica]SEP67447.1 Tetratricopeptide repeat-containing protein [Solimonas aquatica]